MYFIIVHLVAAIVLLLWAVRMVRTAERAYSAQPKRTFVRAERNAFSAAMVGTGMAAACKVDGGGGAGFELRLWRSPRGHGHGPHAAPISLGAGRERTLL